MTDRILSPGEREDDYQENNLRPRRLDDYIGQDKIKANLQIARSGEAARRSARPVLFYGPPGLGKTSLSLIIAR